VLARAREGGVTRVLVPAYDVASWENVARLPAHPGVSVALGLHPWAARQALELERLRDLLLAKRAVAIGEIGLDYVIADADRPRQRQVLASQLALASELGLPVMLHCRRAFAELKAMLREHAPGLRGVLHAFSRGPELGREFVALGLHLGLAGTITRSGAWRARTTAVALPLEWLLLETAAPSIALDGVVAQAVEPCHVAAIAASLAVLRGVELETIARSTTENARRLFGLA